MAIYKYSDPSKKQRQVEYATYMIFSSYFKKATCKNSFPEKKLFLYYKELGEKAQVEMEESVIFVVEKQLDSKFGLDLLENIEVDVSIKTIDDKNNSENKNYYFEFIGKDFYMSVAPIVSGTTINYDLRLKCVVAGEKKDETFKLFSFIKKKSNEQWQQNNKKVVKEIEDDENF